MEDIAEKLRLLFAEKLGIQDNAISDETSFRKDLRIDSLDLYEVFQEVEKQFDIVIQDEEASAIDSVGKLISHIREQKH